MAQSKSLVVMAPLFLVLFIDGMGLSLLFPVLNSIIIDTHSLFLLPTVTLTARHVLYGLTTGIFMICWFFGAAMLGDLSDTIGRKKSLMICLIGAFLGYLLSAIAVIGHSIFFLILGRIIAGFTAGSQPVAQAAIVDVSLPEHKARNIGFILLAVSLGFVIGPILGGVLSDTNLVSWFNFSTPLYFAALISLVNAFLLQGLFKETFYRTEKVKIKFYRALQIFGSAFHHKKIRGLSLVLLVMIYGWSNFFTFVSVFALQRYAFDPLRISFLMADLGIGFSIGCGYLVDAFVNRYHMKYIIIISYLATALLILLAVTFAHSYLLWILMAPIGAAIAVGYSTIIALFSNQVGDNEQGWIMGVTGSIMALCFGLTSFTSGYLSDYGVAVPMYLAVAGIGISALLMMGLKKERLNSKHE